MGDLVRTNVFQDWLDALRDHTAKSNILRRLDRLALGNAGDAKPLGDGVWEMRIAVGPGYRVYYTQVGPVIIVVLCGGDKSSQTKDIARAKAIAKELKG